MNFVFHQALFGYDGGHQLLATSLALPTEARHSLAVATDISGSAPAMGFDQVYTGGPLIGTDFYALYCTWLAPEMPRPGCVWSQVLLLELPDLAELPDLGSLRSLFVRPVATLELDVYSRPFRFSASPERLPRFSSGRETLAGRLLEALYANANRPVVLAAEDASEHEELMFALWSQQWPRLRRIFRFSTGSFADRGRNGPAFDLQITPQANLRAWSRNKDYLFIDKMANIGRAEPWLREAINDLCAPNSRRLRSFMNSYGTDVVNPRSSFVRLVHAFHQTRNPGFTNWTQTLKSIAQTFPNPSEATRLKEWVLSPPSSVGDQDVLELGLATIAFLLNDPEAQAYSSIPYDYNLHISRLWNEKRENLLELFPSLVRKDSPPAASSFASAITKLLHPSEFKEIWETRQELFSIIITSHPSLAFNFEFWRLPISAQWRIIEVLTQAKLKQKDWGEVVAAMLLAGTDVGVTEAVQRAGPYAIEAAFRCLENGAIQERLPSSTWREALGSPAADLLATLKPLSPSYLALCAWLAPSDSKRQIDPGRLDVQELARTPMEDLPQPLLLSTAFLLTTLGLRAEGNEGFALLARGFFRVYESLAAEAYPWEAWRLLSSELPDLGWFRDWDKCEKLRHGVQNWLASRGIAMNSLRKFADTAERSEVLRKLLESDSEKFFS